ncbi:MAG: phosphatase PAP2 family protein [Acutalibacteraceae bacterium]|nr:phosphatase PAP2 family protein [Acutalibacteraceae bacterium]
MFKRIQYVDDLMLNWIGRLHSPILNKIMIVISMLGTKGTIWILLCIPFILNPKTMVTGVNFLVAIGITSAFGEGLIKHLVCRMRPCHKLEDEDLIVKRPDFYSFPSGHTASSFSVLAVALLRCETDLCISIFIIAFLISFSRLYLRVHYLTDVLCGMVLGLLCGTFSVTIMNRLIVNILFHS